MGNILAGQGADDMTCAIQMVMPSMAVMVGVPGQAFFGTMRVHNKQNTCSHAGHVVHYIYIYISFMVSSGGRGVVMLTLMHEKQSENETLPSYTVACRCGQLSSFLLSTQPWPQAVRTP